MTAYKNGRWIKDSKGKFIKEGEETNATWKKQPANMIRKVAMVHALREAFPEQFEGTVAEEEMPTIPPRDVKQIHDALPAGDTLALEPVNDTGTVVDVRETSGHLEPPPA